MPPADWVLALWQVIREVANSFNDRAAYKRLRSLSGSTPAPLGEEEFKALLAHIQETLLTWQIPDDEKHHCLFEVLREPMFGIVRTAKQQNPGITTLQYLQVFQDMYGWPS